MLAKCCLNWSLLYI